MKKLKHAIIIGGSIAGLLTARVLADYFEKITILDRDDFPEEPAFRKGVPQSHHLHLLLIRGKQILEQLFPGFSEDMIKNGAMQCDAGNDFLSITPFGRMRNSPTGLHLLTCSRALIEWYIYQRIRQLPNITIRTKTTVSGYLFNADKTRIRGVQLRPKGKDTVPADITADFVVDASGRNTKTPKWLAQHGYPAPPTTIVNAHLAYATRWYNAPTTIPTAWKGLVINVSPPDNPRAAALIPVEGDRWVITLAGTAGVVPPTDEAGFEAFTRKLSDPIVYDTLQGLEPISKIYGYQNAFNEWKHFEKMTRFPGGLVVLGDAVCAFNPVYGQGMTVAAMSALELGKSLGALSDPDTIPDRFGLQFQKRLTKLYATPWQLATGEDFRWEQTEGERPGILMRINHWYADQVLKISKENEMAGRTFIEVIHLLKSPIEMLKPEIFFRAIMKGLFS